MAASQTASLCEYCKQIDFSIMRLPTDMDLKAANSGAVVDAQPFRQTRARLAGLARPPRWRLGSRARIEKSSASCGLCAAICAVVRDTPDLQAALGSQKAKDCGLLCSAGVEGTLEFHPLPGNEWEVRTGYYRSYRLGLDWWPPKAPEDLKLLPGKVGGEYNAAVGRDMVSAADCFQTRGGEKKGGGRSQFGGRIRPPMISMELPKRWLKECMENHGGECKGWSAARQAAKGTGSSSSSSEDSAAPKLPPLLRLIDTHSKKLVEFKNPAAQKLHYAALSYVWGENQRLKLLSSNRDALKQPNSLAGEVVSPTIQDAIQFVADLDVPYIWVDALCIVQNDDADKAVQIGAMCDIYAGAAVTIIAAAGPDAASRLPGVRVPGAPAKEVPRAREQVRVRVGPDMELLTSLAPRVDHHTAASQAAAAIPGDAHVLNGTAWSTRGWTLQERAVSRRLLAFTPQQLVWTCPTLSESEETECSSQLATARLDSLGSRTPQRLSFTEHYANGPSPSSSNKEEEEEEESYRRFWYAFQHLVLDFSSRELRLQGDSHDAFSAVLAQATSMTGEEFVWALPAGRFALALTWTPWREGLKRRTELTTLPTTTLNKQVPFPSWSWLGWMGKVQYRIGEQVQSGLEPDVVCYTVRHPPNTVKNEPKTKVHLIGSAADPSTSKLLKARPSEVTLEHLKKQNPKLGGQAGLDGIPDNQVILFWAECAYFTISARQAMGRGMFIRFVYDSSGVNVGRISPCREDVHEDGAGTKNRRFAHLATCKQKSIPSEKMVLMLQPGRPGDGVWYRSDMAVIEEDNWLGAKPKRELVALA